MELESPPPALPSPSPKQRTPRQKLTEHDAGQMDLALERCQGNKAHAARILGLTEIRFYNLLRKVPRLKAKWCLNSDDAPKGRVAEIDRKKPVMPFSPQDQMAVMALDRQDAVLARGWKQMGFTDEERGFLVNLQTSYADATGSVLRLTGAGVAHTYTRLLFVFEDLVKKIKDVDDHPADYVRTMTNEGGYSYETKGPHEYRCELYDRLISVAAELRKVTTDVQRLALVRAQIEKLKIDSSGSVRKKQGWGSGPPPVAVQVNVHQNQPVEVTTSLEVSGESDEVDQ